MSLYSIVYIPVLLYLYFFKQIRLLVIIFFVFSGFTGMLIEFMTWYMIGILSLYFEKIKGMIRIAAAVKVIVSGNLIPLHIMPQSMQKMTLFFPFRYNMYVPVNNLLQNVAIRQHIISFLYACLWLAFFELYNLYFVDSRKKTITDRYLLDRWIIDKSDNLYVNIEQNVVQY